MSTIYGNAMIIKKSGNSSVAIQNSKSVTITSNGTTTITPNVGYDAIKQVNVTTHVNTSATGFQLQQLDFADLNKNYSNCLINFSFSDTSPQQSFAIKVTTPGSIYLFTAILAQNSDDQVMYSASTVKNDGSVLASNSCLIFDGGNYTWNLGEEGQPPSDIYNNNFTSIEVYSLGPILA